MRIIIYNLLLGIFITSLVSCEKLVAIDNPIDTITTAQVFSSDDQALNAMAGIYATMINGKDGSGRLTSQWSLGLTTLLCGLSADELNCINASSGQYDFNTNKLKQDNFDNANYWNSAWNTVYGANAVIEGVQASTSKLLSDAVRRKVIAEARFLRAFSYFYLTNLYGDLPLVLTIDFNQTRNLPRTPQAKIYEQIISDLLTAQTDLPPVNTSTGGERIYPDKWAATALLSRVYLYVRDYEKAYQQANDVIGNMPQFSLAATPDAVFNANSQESIWQLKQSPERSFGQMGNATSEGYTLIPRLSGSLGEFLWFVSDDLMNAFENGDQRKIKWTDKAIPFGSQQEQPYPAKYRIGPNNIYGGNLPAENYVVLRLAEQYLIRAEAAAHGAASLQDAINDLDQLRVRAGLAKLPDDLSEAAVLAAIAQERRVELCFEWGHRWFDLKRTGQAPVLLPQLPRKQPWAGDYQLLYPIPADDLRANPAMSPNPGYF